MLKPTHNLSSSEQLSPQERDHLLKLARAALEEGILHGHLSNLELEDLPDHLRQAGVAFVTLTVGGRLRGCIGGLEATQPLAEDVRQHALAAGTCDYRFSPLRPEELPEVLIEISRLTCPQVLLYECPEDLLARLRPGIDGVVLVDGHKRATFLPQVWGKISNPGEFLSALCQKMGAAPDLWQRKPLTVLTYQVEEFHE